MEHVTVTMKEGLSRKAQALGVNVSKTCTLALENAVEKLEHKAEATTDKQTTSATTVRGQSNVTR